MRTRAYTYAHRSLSPVQGLMFRLMCRFTHHPPKTEASRTTQTARSRIQCHNQSQKTCAKTNVLGHRSGFARPSAPTCCALSAGPPADLCMGWQEGDTVPRVCASRCRCRRMKHRPLRQQHARELGRGMINLDWGCGGGGLAGGAPTFRLEPLRGSLTASLSERPLRFSRLRKQQAERAPSHLLPMHLLMEPMPLSHEEGGSAGM